MWRSRAATYLGLTCTGAGLPEKIRICSPALLRIGDITGRSAQRFKIGVCFVRKPTFAKAF